MLPPARTSNRCKGTLFSCSRGAAICSTELIAMIKADVPAIQGGALRTPNSQHASKAVVVSVSLETFISGSA